MPALTHATPEHIRPPNGTTFWSFSAEELKELTFEDLHVTKVRWGGREWICKRDERTLNEVVGYQIASTFGLPLQPWLAFECPEPRSLGAGVFVEWWAFARSQFSLVGLSQNHAALIARGLAFWVFGRADWPEWLLSGDMTELRLIDLDGTGPRLTVPPQKALLRSYLDATESVLRVAQREAGVRGISDAFFGELRRLLAVDFSSVVDLSGYPGASALVKMMLSGIQSRQRKLGKLLPRY